MLRSSPCKPSPRTKRCLGRHGTRSFRLQPLLRTNLRAWLRAYLKSATASCARFALVTSRTRSRRQLFSRAGGQRASIFAATRLFSARSGDKSRVCIQSKFTRKGSRMTAACEARHTQRQERLLQLVSEAIPRRRPNKNPYWSTWSLTRGALRSSHWLLLLCFSSLSLHLRALYHDIILLSSVFRVLM